jgi:hypothetical protein
MLAFNNVIFLQLILSITKFIFFYLTLSHFTTVINPVLRIRIRMFLGLLDPDPYPLVRGMDPDPDADPYIIKQK